MHFNCLTLFFMFMSCPCIEKQLKSRMNANLNYYAYCYTPHFDFIFMEGKTNHNLLKVYLTHICSFFVYTNCADVSWQLNRPLCWNSDRSLDFRTFKTTKCFATVICSNVNILKRQTVTTSVLFTFNAVE